MPTNGLNPKILNLFPVFDGDSELLEDYIERFNTILNAFSMNKVMAIRILKLKVTGRALRALKTAEKERTFNDYQTLIDELGKHLATKGRVIKAKYGLAITMKDDESLQDFAERIRKNVKIAYPHFPEAQQESLMSDNFVTGIKGDLREKLMKKTFNTLEDALSKAEREMDRRQMTRLDILERKIDELNNVLKTQINFIYQNGYDDGYSNEEGNLDSSEYCEEDRSNERNAIERQFVHDSRDTEYGEYLDHRAHEYESWGENDNVPSDTQLGCSRQYHSANHSFPNDSHYSENPSNHPSFGDDYDQDNSDRSADMHYNYEHVEERENFSSGQNDYRNDHYGDEKHYEREDVNELHLTNYQHDSSNAVVHNSQRNYVNYLRENGHESPDNTHYNHNSECGDDISQCSKRDFINPKKESFENSQNHEKPKRMTQQEAIDHWMISVDPPEEIDEDGNAHFGYIHGS